MESERRKQIFVGRHFDDVRDLRYEFDPVLVPLTEQEKGDVLVQMRELAAELKQKQQQDLILLSSHKIRGRDSVRIYKDVLKEVDPGLSVRIGFDQRFADLDHGKVIIPRDYKPGDSVDFLPEAWNAFWNETFNVNGTIKNPEYRYGNPLSSNGTEMYPSLKGNFQEYGESYREFFLRHLQAIVDYYKIYETDWDRSWSMVLVAHSSTIRLLEDIEDCASDPFFMKNYIPGQLMSMCRAKRLTRSKDPKASMPYGEIRMFPQSEFSREFMKMLEYEINLLSEKDAKQFEPRLKIPAVHKSENQGVREYAVRTYDPAYVEAFEKERDFLLSVLSPITEKVEHVGSTSVPGLNGKSTIDILIETNDLGTFTEEMLRSLLGKGYKYYVADYGTRIFLFKEEGGGRSYHVHLVERGNERGKRMLAFRDLLRTHPDLVEEYNGVKKEYFEKSQGNYEAYRVMKDDWIRKTMFKYGLEE